MGLYSTYKVKVYSGDGSTFLRQIILNVPRVKGDGQLAGTGTAGSFSRESWGAFCGVVNTDENWLHTKAEMSPFWTAFYCNSDSTTAAAFFSGGSAINMYNFITPTGPQTNTAIRLVFNNGAYIKITCTDASTFRYNFAYYDKNDVSYGSITIYLTQNLSSTSNVSKFCFLPFVYANQDGTITDYKLRTFTDFNTYSACYYDVTYDISRERYTWVVEVTPSTGTPKRGFPTEVAAVDLTNFYQGVKPLDPSDPYSDVPDSEPSGPAAGTGIPANDPVDIPGLPTASAIDTGFISLFNPTLAQVKALADFMWTNTLFDINNLKKIFANPMDCILGFNMVPVDVPSGSLANVTIGNIISTVTMNMATSQWVEKDCGSLNVDQWIGNYMDFAPDSKYSIYLPYIGVRELSTDDLVGKTVKLVYHVDVLSCSCIAFLKCGDSVLYEFAGQCGYSIPVTNTDFTQMIANICRLTIGIGGAVAGGGMSAQGVGNMVDAVMGLKPQIHRSGSVGGSTGLMGGQTPYLIMELPNICKPERQYHYLGYPSFVTKKLGNLSGFASFESVILDGIGCTDEERNIILAMCREGIYL